MDRDTMIALAREAEQYANTFCESIGDTEHNHWFDAYNERFAALVAAHERERICKQIAMLHDSLSLTGTTNWGKP